MIDTLSLSLSSLVRRIGPPHMPALNIGIAESAGNRFGVGKAPWPQRSNPVHGNRRMG
jgi:hypothetical protein